MLLYPKIAVFRWPIASKLTIFNYGRYCWTICNVKASEKWRIFLILYQHWIGLKKLPHNDPSSTEIRPLVQKLHFWPLWRPWSLKEVKNQVPENIVWSGGWSLTIFLGFRPRAAICSEFQFWPHSATWPNDSTKSCVFLWTLFLAKVICIWPSLCKFKYFVALFCDS